MPGKGLKIGIVGLVLAIAPAGIWAQGVVDDRIVPDTAVIKQQYDKSTQFYGRLKERSGESRFAERLYRALVSEDPRISDEARAGKTLEKEIHYYQPFEGKTINSISILRNNIFRDEYAPNDYRTLTNSVHKVTRENTIRRNLLFQEGDRVSASVLARNEQLLRSLSYFLDVYIVVSETDGQEGVDINIMSRDAWSIGFSIHPTPNGERYIDIYDSNFLGSGNRLDLRTYVNYRDDMYGGNMLQFHTPNLLGSFFELDAAAGEGYQAHEYGIKLDKDFILPSDFMAGGIVEDRKYYESQVLRDTMFLIRQRNYDAWAGKSWNFPLVKGSYYLSGRFRDLTYHLRPEIRPDSNTYYDSYRAVLFNTGIYRETYYKGNMIYGYGREENIPYGHKFQFTGGKYWGEFGDKWYSSFLSSMGKQTRIGYFSAEASVSSFWDADGKPLQSTLELNFDGFSNLWEARRNYFRQFLSLHYLNGFNRLKGEGERVAFWPGNNIVGLQNDGNNGKVRLVANLETVMFTPLYFYGFRFAFFSYADFGWIGDKNMPFRNDFYSAVGVGVRIKNERLVFNTIQLQLGLALRNGRMADYRHFRFSGQQHFNQPEFKAQKPEFFQFR